MVGVVTQKRCIIAVDGPAGAGKSTVARAVAEALGYTYIDTGSLYRALTWAALKAGIDPQKPGAQQALAHLATHTRVTLQPGPQGHRVFVNGEDVTDAIRSAETSAAVSFVAANEQVRRRLVALQRQLAGSGPVVMDGRDIGTVVFPDADVKVFLTASVAERARRRFAQTQHGGQGGSLEAVLENIEQRDAMDAGRAVAPLRKAADAVEIDTTDKTVAEVVNDVLRLVQGKEGLPCTP